MRLGCGQRGGYNPNNRHRFTRARCAARRRHRLRDRILVLEECEEAEELVLCFLNLLSLETIILALKRTKKPSPAALRTSTEKTRRAKSTRRAKASFHPSENGHADEPANDAEIDDLDDADVAAGASANGKPEASGRRRRATAHTMAAKQRDISVSEFFAKNRHLLGFDNPRKALLTTVKEAVDNSLDACEEAGILPEIWVHVEQTGADRYKVGVQDNGPGIVKKQIPLSSASFCMARSFTVCARVAVSRASASALPACTACKRPASR